MDIKVKNKVLYCNGIKVSEKYILLTENNELWLLCITDKKNKNSKKVIDILNKCNIYTDRIKGDGYSYYIEKTLLLNSAEYKKLIENNEFEQKDLKKQFESIKKYLRTEPKDQSRNIICVKYGNICIYSFVGLSFLKGRKYRKKIFSYDKNKISVLHFGKKEFYAKQIGLKDNCEDAPPVAMDNYLIVCDGLGGRGLKEVNIDDKIYTNAYLGSRFVSRITQQFFKENKFLLNKIILYDNKRLEYAIQILKDKIKNELSEYTNRYDVEYTNTFPSFPTTLASAFIVEQNDSKCRILLVYCGDSQIYALNPTAGLMLLCSDNNDEEAMSDYVSGTKDFYLNYSVYETETPVFIVACSDGFYKRFKSNNLFFEYLLVKSVAESNDRLQLSEDLFKRLNDDTTVSGMLIGNKDLFIKRFNQLDELVSNLQNMTKEKSEEFLSINQPNYNNRGLFYGKV